jgi:cbb3-type cytochrome oxidase maturation protein
MGIITLLISISISIALVFLGIFLWSLRSGQFDDTVTPAMRMIFDDHKPQQNENEETKEPSAPDKNQTAD